MLGSPGVSHLNIKSFLVALSSKAMDTVVATRRDSLFLSRTTSAMVTQRAFQLLRSTGLERIWQMKLDVTSSCSATCHDRGSLDIRHARNQSWGCGAWPLRSLRAACAIHTWRRSACSVVHTGSSCLNQDASANLCACESSWAEIRPIRKDRVHTKYSPKFPAR